MRAPGAAGTATEDTLPTGSQPLGGGNGMPPRVYDRIVRVVTLVFIAAIAVAITIADLWPATRSAIYVVLGLMLIFLVLVQDIIPPGLLGRRRFALEGIVGIGFVTVLAVLTGGAASPLFFGYFLIVAGGALWASGSAPAIVALVTAVVYLVGMAA